MTLRNLRLSPDLHTLHMYTQHTHTNTTSTYREKTYFIGNMPACHGLKVPGGWRQSCFQRDSQPQLLCLQVCGYSYNYLVSVTI